MPRFGINKVKLQHGAGYLPLSVECDYKSNGICQHPLLHDLEDPTASFELIGDSIPGGNLVTNMIRQLNTKSQAMSSAAYIKAYKNKIHPMFRNGQATQVTLFEVVYILLSTII